MLKTTVDDLFKVLKYQRLCLALAVEDLKDRYRRSALGVIWIAVSFFAFIGIYAAIFGELNPGNPSFILFLVIGFALWTFINALIVDGVNCYLRCSSWILSCNLPYSVYLLQFIYRAILDFSLIAVSALMFCFLFTDIHLTALPVAFFGLCFYALTGLGLTMVLAPMGARFRDSIHATKTIMRIAFFATPIIWVPAPGTIRSEIAFWNPAAHYISIIREPLMGSIPDPVSWMVVLAITGISLLLGVVGFAVTKKGVPLWL